MGCGQSSSAASSAQQKDARRPTETAGDRSDTHGSKAGQADSQQQQQQQQQQQLPPKDAPDGKQASQDAGVHNTAAPCDDDDERLTPINQPNHAEEESFAPIVLQEKDHVPQKASSTFSLLSNPEKAEVTAKEVADEANECSIESSSTSRRETTTTEPSSGGGGARGGSFVSPVHPGTEPDSTKQSQKSNSSSHLKVIRPASDGELNISGLMSVSHVPPIAATSFQRSGRQRHRMVDFVSTGEDGAPRREPSDDEVAFAEWKRHSIIESSPGQTARRCSFVGNIAIRRQRRRTLQTSFMGPGDARVHGLAYVQSGPAMSVGPFDEVCLCHHVLSRADHYQMRLIRFPTQTVGCKPDLMANLQMLKKLNHGNIQNIVDFVALDSETPISARQSTADNLTHDLAVIEDSIACSISDKSNPVPLTPGEVLRDVARGLRYLHSNNIFHLHLTENCVASQMKQNPSPNSTSGSGLYTVVIQDCATGSMYRCLSADALYDNGCRDPGQFPPEVINEEWESPLAARDSWALGALAFRLFVGISPFGCDSCESKDEFLAAILSKPLGFPPDFDANAVKLVSSLLSREPSERPALFHVLRHRFLRDLGGVASESLVLSTSSPEGENSASKSVSHESLVAALETSHQKGSMLISPSDLSNREIAILEMTGELPEGILAVEATLATSARLERKRSRKKLMTEAEMFKEEVGSVDDAIDDCIESNDMELHLANMKLTSIPSRVFESPFDCITLLDLFNNDLTELPDSIRFLVGITTLLLGSNKLTELPDAIGDLSELVYLDVNHNQLTDLPQSLMFADQLASLAMDYNDVVEFPQVIGDLPLLRTLYLAANPRLCQWPTDPSMFQTHSSLQIGIDNEPNLVLTEDKHMRNPLIKILWNKVYPDPIVPGIYCGSLRSAQSPHVYQKLGIQYVLTAGRGLEVTVGDDMRHKVIIVDDVPGATIDDTFDEAIEFIDEAQQAGSGCLVHCFAGMSRSATTVIAYLMKRRGMRLDEAYLTTKRGRPAIYPNAGFFTQLLNYDAKLFPDGRPLDIESLHREIVP